MATAFIYFREAENNTDFDNIANPVNLATANKVEFDTLEDLMETVSWHYENNIKDSPISLPDGSRVVAKQDNGLMSVVWTIKGRFRDDAGAGLVKLKNFAKDKQVESVDDTNALQFGKFGFYSDNTVLKPFNLDPVVRSGTKQGLTIRSVDITRTGQVPKNFDFTVIMTFGGTFIG